MARIIQIDNRRWVVGMTWSSFEDVPSKAELKDDAERLNASWSCVRIGESAIQAGFCAPIDNAKRPSKLYSLAAMLADSREQPWLGIFKISEGVWWYIAVRDGHAILPDGDVIGGEDEIHTIRECHSGYTDWKYIDGDIAQLRDLINDVGAKPTPIRALYESYFSLLPLVSTIVLLSVIGGGGYFWWHKKQQEHERQVAMAKMRAQLAASQSVASAPSPLLSTPQPNSWLAACANIISTLPLSQNGWALDQVSCSTASVVVHWVRKDGATVAAKPTGNLTPQGDIVDQEIPLVGLERTGSDNAVKLPDAKLALRAWAQTAGFILAMTEQAPPPLLPGAKPNPDVPPPPPQANITLDISISPFGLDLSKIPGLRLTSLSSTGTGWRLEGVLYGH